MFLKYIFLLLDLRIRWLVSTVISTKTMTAATTIMTAAKAAAITEEVHSATPADITEDQTNLFPAVHHEAARLLTIEA